MWLHRLIAQIPSWRTHPHWLPPLLHIALTQQPRAIRLQPHGFPEITPAKEYNSFPIFRQTEHFLVLVFLDFFSASHVISVLPSFLTLSAWFPWYHLADSPTPGLALSSPASEPLSLSAKWNPCSLVRGSYQFKPSQVIIPMTHMISTIIKTPRTAFISHNLTSDLNITLPLDIFLQISSKYQQPIFPQIIWLSSTLSCPFLITQ